MLEQTSYYGLVDEDFLDAIDPVDETIAESLYDNSDCIENASRINYVNEHDIAHRLDCLEVANDMFCSRFYNS